MGSKGSNPSSDRIDWVQIRAHMGSNLGSNGSKKFIFGSNGFKFGLKCNQVGIDGLTFGSNGSIMGSPGFKFGLRFRFKLFQRASNRFEWAQM